MCMIGTTNISKMAAMGARSRGLVRRNQVRIRLRGDGQCSRALRTPDLRTRRTEYMGKMGRLWNGTWHSGFGERRILTGSGSLGWGGWWRRRGNLVRDVQAGLHCRTAALWWWRWASELRHRAGTGAAGKLAEVRERMTRGVHCEYKGITRIVKYGDDRLEKQEQRGE